MSSIVAPIVVKRVGRKPGAMSAEAKAAMLLKRAATLAAKGPKAAAPAAAPAPKDRKKRAPLSDEAKKNMAAKRAATLAAKAAKAASDSEAEKAEVAVADDQHLNNLEEAAAEQAQVKKERKQRAPMSAEAKAAMAAKRAATVAAKKAAEQPLPPSPAEEESEAPATPKVHFAEPIEAPPAPQKAEAPTAAAEDEVVPEPPVARALNFDATLPPRPKGPKPPKKAKEEAAKVDESSADESSGAEEGKKRKQREPMTAEAKAAMAAKRAATIAAKKAAQA